MNRPLARTFSSKLIMTIALGIFLCGNLYAQDQTDPAWTAKKILATYKAKDWKGMLAYTIGGNKKITNQLINGETSPRLKSITSGWRWREVSGWNGKIGEVRIGQNDTRHVKFSQKGKECFIVSMSAHNGKWFFNDIHSPSCESFSTLKKL